MTPAGTNLLLASADATPAPVDVVTKSLRFNAGDNAYLSRTPSAGNRTAWTFSTWVKRAELGTRQIIFACRVSTARFYLEFTSGNTIEVSEWTGSAYSLRLITSAVYRDVGGWYHLVFKYDSTPSTPDSTSVSLYVNGEQVTSFSTATYPSQNVTTSINAAALHTIGERADLGGSNYDGYLADVNFIDGTALTPTSFAEEDATTGQWEPKAFSGTYGTNGFHLDFEDDTAIGNDVSGNNNDFTASNLAASDVVPDCPTNNYCTFNPLNAYSAIVGMLAEGNTRVISTTGASGYQMMSTMGVSSGKWYYEYRDDSPSTRNTGVGWVDSKQTPTGSGAGAINQNGAIFYHDYIYVNGGGASAGAQLDNGDIAGVALDADAGKIWFSLNGTWWDSQDPAAGSNAKYTASTNSDIWVPSFMDGNYGQGTVNYGQDGTFNGTETAQGNADGNGHGDFYYSPPSGFLALCSKNLPTPTIAKPSEHFSTTLYSGSGGTQSITTGHEPDLLWIKNRAHTGDMYHELYDDVRGLAEGALNSNNSGVGDGVARIASLDSTGFTTASTSYAFTNATGNTYVAWSWKKSAAAGFNIVGWTGDDDGFSGGTQAVAHGLGVAPEMVIAKNRTNEAGGSGNWIVYHKDTTSGDLLKLNTTDGEFTPNSTLIGSIGSTNVSFGNDSFDYEYLNSDNSFGSGTPDTYIGYFFASVEGYSKCGSINSSSSSAFCFLGFRPSFILAKRSDATGGNWLMFDDKRDGYNVDNDDLMANSSAVEATTDHIDILSNGFKIRTSDADLNGGTLIYLAVAKNPFKYASAR